MNALADDQKAIEEILEGERVRMAESFRSTAAARKARDEKHAEEDDIEEKCVQSTNGTGGLSAVQSRLSGWCFVKREEQHCSRIPKVALHRAQRNTTLSKLKTWKTLQPLEAGSFYLCRNVGSCGLMGAILINLKRSTMMSNNSIDEVRNSPTKAGTNKDFFRFLLPCALPLNTHQLRIGLHSCARDS